MNALFLILALVVLYITIRSLNNNGGKKEKVLTKSILTISSLEDVVSAIGYGRLYPFFTSMPISEIESILKKGNKLSPEFISSFEMSEMMGFFSSLVLCNPGCAGIKEVRAKINRNKVASSYSIVLSNKQVKEEAKGLLAMKFGAPYSDDMAFTIWRAKYMVISLAHESNTIYIIDESLPM